MPNRQQIDDDPSEKPTPVENGESGETTPAAHPLKRAGSSHAIAAHLNVATVEEGDPEMRIEVTYTTKSGETVTTFKSLAPEISVHLSEMPDRPVTGITVIGYTFSGKRHLTNIVENKGCRVRFLVEDDSALCAEAKEQLEKAGCYGFEIVGFKDLQRAISSPQIDLVVVSTSIDKKKQAASDALQAGKTVLVDKPMGLTEADVKQLFSLSRKCGKQVMTVLPGRPGYTFKSVTLAMLSSASRVTIRRLTKAEVLSGALPPRKPIQQATETELQTMLVDMAMHDVFAVNFCMCMRPTEAVARILPEDPSTVEVQLAYPNQTQVRVLCAIGQVEDEAQQFTLWGPRLAEMQRIDHMKRVDIYDSASVGASPAEEGKDSLRFTQHYEESHKDALEQMYAAASGHKRFASRARPQLMEQNVLDCLRIAASASRSLKAAGAPVNIIYTV